MNRRTQDLGRDSDRLAGPVPHGDEGTQEIRSVTVSPWNRLTVNVGSAGTGSSLHQRTQNQAPSEEASRAGTDPMEQQRTLGSHDTDSSANRMYLDQTQTQPESTEIVTVGTESSPQGLSPLGIEIAVDASPSGAGSPQWGGWGCEVSCGGHHRPRGKTTTGSALDGAVFDIAQILAYLVHNMSRSQLYLGFGHFG